MGLSSRGDQPKFDNLKIGYDNNSDDDIADAGDDIVVDENFASTSVTISHGHAGNLIDDGTFRYVYDAWNRLVTVKSSTDSGAVTFQTAEFDARGRRMKKMVDNSGDFDGTEVYLLDGHKIIETRDGSDNVVQQFIHGTRYIGNGLWPDELVMMRAIDKGDLYIHQDANWNVIALTDLGGSVVERYVYTPYGELTVHQETAPGDYDGDDDVDSTDRAAAEGGGACRGSSPTGACRILDHDFDNDVDDDDLTLFDALDQGLSRHPARTSTGVHQPFAHQGLLYEPELGSYQNRARQYDPAMRRFYRRDPLGFAGGGMNVYAYLRGNQFMFNDPTGTICTHVPGAPHAADSWCEHICDSDWLQTLLQDLSAVAITICCVSPTDNSDPLVDNCAGIVCGCNGVDFGSCPNICAMEHEDNHLEHMSCSCDCRMHQSCGCESQLCEPVTHGPRWESECSAYTAQIACLISGTCKAPQTQEWLWMLFHATCMQGWLCDHHMHPESAAALCDDGILPP